MVDRQESVDIHLVNTHSQVELRDGQRGIDLEFLVFLCTHKIIREFPRENLLILRTDGPEIHGKLVAAHIVAIHTAIAVELHSRHGAVYRDVRRAKAETVAPVDTVSRPRW